MKERYFTRGARIPIYKAIAITKNPNVFSLVCTIWESKESNIGLELAYQLRLYWAIKMLGRPCNFMHIICNELDMIDLSQELPRLDHMEDIIRCYRDERTRPLLHRLDIIAYHVRMGNDDIIRDMGVGADEVNDIMNRRGIVLRYPRLLTQDEEIRLFHLRHKDYKFEDRLAPLIAVKLGLWDETPYPELSMAICEKDHVIINKYMSEDSFNTIRKLRKLYALPGTSGFCGMDEHGDYIYHRYSEPNLYYYRKNIGGNDGLTDGQWLTNYLLDHPDIKIHESMLGNLLLNHGVHGPALDYVDENNPGDIPYNTFHSYTNLQIAIRWYYRDNMILATNRPDFRNRVDF
ncbi:hypothetical protein BJ944DRAFT_269522, partial [Cunninghamella echinulata]